jgi:hypothetical protein
MSADFPYLDELQVFINDEIDSIEKWDLAVYFCRQAEARETVASLMALTGKPEAAVSRAADGFVAERILSVRRSNNGKPDLYHMASEARPLMEKLRIGLDDRQYRFKLMMLALESIRSRNMVMQEERI